MIAPIRPLVDDLHRVSEVWRGWRQMPTAPPAHHLDHWTVWRSNGGMVQAQFTSEIGWAQWARFLGLDMDRSGPNEWVARGFIDQVRFVFYVTHRASDEAGAA